MPAAVAPVAEAERLQALDVLRGFAILGILLMNVSMFAMPYAAYFNPYALGEPSFRDLLIWSADHLFADQKFMTIFSFLFGAGVLLMTTRAEESGVKPARFHYRRMAWLLVFGLMHAYLLWHGDILVFYAVCGMVIYPARRLRARTLTVLGITMLGIGSAIMLAGGLTMPTWGADEIADWQRFWNPPSAEIAAETSAFQGGWLSQQPWRTQYSAESHLEDIVFWGLWRAGGLMLLGMALLKSGVISGRRTRRFYARLTAAGFAVGLPLVTWGLYRQNATGWNVRDGFFIASQWNYWGSVLVALGYIGLILMIWQAAPASGAMARLAAAGRMAFSCYIFETLVATTVFYGHGLGLFGRVDRLQQLLFVVGVWVVILIVAPLWLARFRYGPLEWAWRSLTYGRMVPMARQSHVAAAV
jgi:uncharacterized protein